ncbi:MAG TPA: DUF29 domain-containing protein [Bryobacteraceae bacterium]|nr:DUF29 domain-containing protein [Bryobacteraceae bacterium]
MQPTATKPSELYEQDFYQWAMANAALIREGRIAELDFENLAEEIESLGRSERHQLDSRLTMLLTHLLKRELQPHKRDNRSWLTSIVNQRIRLARVLKMSPGLRRFLSEAVADSYPQAVRVARTQTAETGTPLPAECPWTVEQLLDPGYLP